MDTVSFIKEYPNIFPFKVVVSLLKYLNKIEFKKAHVVDPTNSTGASYQINTRKTAVFDIFYNSKTYTEVHYFNLMRKKFIAMVF